MADKKRNCFVVMGFKTKRDPKTGREIDLDKTYRGIIKPAATEAGYNCFRADEIRTTGLIDIPMYEWLRDADLVIADLSTLNPNAFFELGVRYALRPRSTIVMAEDGIDNPFDTNHVSFELYRHDGKSLDFEVVDETKRRLLALIKATEDDGKIDSPVHIFLDNFHDGKPDDCSLPEECAVDAPSDELARIAKTTYSVVREQIQFLFLQKKFSEAAALLEGVRLVQRSQVSDEILQKLVLATYKSEEPDILSSLLNAREICNSLKPNDTLDAETIGLWGAIHKRLSGLEERLQGDKMRDLSIAIEAQTRAFYLLNDYYNGINAAFLHDKRASITIGEDAIADRVLAKRLRNKVISIARDIINGGVGGETEQEKAQNLYWVKVSLAEAYFGVCNIESGKRALAEAWNGEFVYSWMRDTAAKQISELIGILPDYTTEIAEQLRNWIAEKSEVEPSY